MGHTECPPGKDAPLSETIALGTRLLAEMNLDAGPVSWLNPAPHCWSVHFQVKGCPPLASNGKGTSREACLAGALGEFFERLATNFYFSDYFLDNSKTAATAPDFLFYPDEQWFPCSPEEPPPAENRHGVELFGDGLRQFYDPDDQVTAADLADHNSDPARGGICALPFTNLETGQKIFLPVGVLNNLYVSNGMAAGNSATEASAQALAEILERHVKNQVIAAGLSLPEVPSSRLHQLPGVVATIGRLRERALELRILDASLGGQFPVICALLSNHRTGGACAAFGASCRFAGAIERTVTELLQGRSLEMLDDFPPLCHDQEEVADLFNLESHFVNGAGLLAWRMFRDQPDFTPAQWDFHGDSRAEWQQLLQLVHTRGFAVYRAEYRHCGIYTCRLVVPGMSEIYPVDDLLYNNRASGRQLRGELLDLPKKGKEELDRLLQLIDSLPLSDRQLVAEAIGILFPPDSAWAGLTLGELKALLQLAIGHKEEALAWCNWCLDQGVLAENRLRFFKLLQTILRFESAGEEFSTYRQNLGLFYSEEELGRAEA
ncbi:MAG TPA: YcaO-like family protein, partial [Desulforhopalus sp.]|nr:YcaO-like family protein [Desulforhopalus sp.]